MAKQAIIVDMDGTLANVNHRLHYVNSKPKNFDAFEAECHMDVPYEPIKMIVNAIALTGEVKILIVSARQGDRRLPTIEWLEKYNIHFDSLYMRTQGDTRKDDIVKKELLDKIREDGYDVLFAIDDRKRVKRMWVENGIFVLDVNQKDKEY